MACRRRWLLGSLTACSCALAAAGCGSSERAAPRPQLPRAVAQRLAAEADAVAARYRAGDRCGARDEALRLQGDALAAINGGRVPAAFQEDLQSAANGLAARISCEPVTPASPPGKGKGKGHGHGKGKNKHGGEGDGD